MAEPPDNLRMSLVVGLALRFAMDPAHAVGAVLTRRQAVEFFKRRTLGGLLL
jgi:hypothetical protein